MSNPETPKYPEFRKVVLEDKGWMTSLFEEHPTEISERTFGSIYVWRGYQDRSLVSDLDGHLLISWRREKLGRTVLEPVGPDPEKAVARLMDLAHERDMPFAGIFGLVEPLVSSLKAKGYAPESVRDEWDYVYLRDDLVGLEGPRYHTQRKEMKKAVSAHGIRYEAMTSEHKEQCLALEETWCDLKHCTLDTFSTAEDAALKEALVNVDQLGFEGGVLVVDGRIEALTLGERLNADTAVVHFEKANPGIRGLYQLINQQFCEHGLPRYKYVNREQDVGEPGLRRAKEGYHPNHYVEKHYLALR